MVVTDTEVTMTITELVMLVCAVAAFMVLAVDSMLRGR